MTMVKLRLKSWSWRLAAAVALCLAGVSAAAAAAAGVQLPVPRITIYPGQVIEEGMLVERAFRSSAAQGMPVATSAESLVGKVARQTLLPGRPIATNVVRDQHVVTQGKATLIVFREGALTITATGLALQSGGTGEVITVRNTDSGRTVKGTVEADGSVNVGDP
jgi:flagellar basal body P-ring formation protein FlgA